MKNREKIREQLSAYLDGELSPGEVKRVAQALESDTELSAELERLRAVSGLVGSLPRLEAPQDLAENVIRQAEHSSLVDSPLVTASPHRMRWVSYLAVAAVITLIASVGVVVITQLLTEEYEPPAVTIAKHDEDEPEKLKDLDKAPTDSSGITDGKILAKHSEKPSGLMPKTRRFSKRVGKGGGAGAGGAGLNDLPVVDEAKKTVNLVIYTDDLVSTQRSVEKVLVGNRIKPVAVRDSGANLNRADKSIRARGSFYHENRTKGRQVQYVVYATDLQSTNISSQLKPVLLSQNVSQKADVRVEELTKANEAVRAKGGLEVPGREITAKSAKKMPATPKSTVESNAERRMFVAPAGGDGKASRVRESRVRKSVAGKSVAGGVAARDVLTRKAASPKKKGKKDSSLRLGGFKRRGQKKESPKTQPTTKPIKRADSIDELIAVLRKNYSYVRSAQKESALLFEAASRPTTQQKSQIAGAKVRKMLITLNYRTYMSKDVTSGIKGKTKEASTTRRTLKRAK